MGLLDLWKNKKVPQPEEYQKTRTYNYDTPEARIATAEWLFSQAANERTAKEADWKRLNDYYNFLHDVAKELAEALENSDLPFSPACVPDPYIMVESQIIPDIPQPEFKGRDSRGDDKTAKIRSLAAKFVVENNRISDMNTANERRLRKYGDAFWKAYWDESMPCGPEYGDIRIKAPALEDIYPDPTTLDLQDGEYVDYVYTLHKNKFWRLYHDELKKQGLSIDDVLERQYRQEDGLFQPYTAGSECREDLIQVLEHWFRQPFDDPKGEFKAGDVACTIQAGGIELRYIPRYWKKTGDQCKLFPFVHYWCIQDETQFWNKSEIESIVPMVDAADRELAMGILNDSLMANDVTVVENGALMPGQELTNTPGLVLEVRQGKINSVRRLGGLSNGVNSLGMVNWFQNQIQRTNRNYDTNNGQETARVTTASGLLQLRADAQVQQQLKKADRNNGFARLYELIDWLCLEFYDDGRILLIGADEKGGEPKEVQYTLMDIAKDIEPVTDLVSGEVLREGRVYYPRVDVTVTAGDGMTKNPANTVEILDKLANVPVTADNWRLLAAELEYLDIPQKQEIVAQWKSKFDPETPEEVLAAVKQDPQLLSAIIKTIKSSGSIPRAAAGGEVIPQQDALAMAAQHAQQADQNSMSLPSL